MLKQVNHQVAVIVVFDTYDRQSNDGRRDQMQKYREIAWEYETDGSIKFITGELELDIII